MKIPFRRLVNPAKRFIISNAHPIIPHDIITEHLSFNIKTLSPISFLKAGFQDELSHISSFRRQIYIHPDDIEKVPGSLIVNYDNTDFRIFLTDDTLTCYLCKQTGHTSNYCKKELNSTNTTINITQKATTEENTPITSSNSTQENNKIEEYVNDIPKNSHNLNTLTQPNTTNTTTCLPNIQTKRSPPSSSCPSLPATPHSPETYPNNENRDQSKNLITKLIESKNTKGKLIEPNKKLKKSNSLENLTTEDILKSIQNIFSKNDEIPMSFSQFNYILENFSNKAINIHTLCNEIMVDISTVSTTIEIVRPMIKDRALKIKLTKLSNLLFQSTPQE
jgi:hypothetical protein